MSIFPKADFASGERPAAPDRDSGLATENMLARPISGFAYQIEEKDLEALRTVERPSPLSGLVSRH